MFEPDKTFHESQVDREGAPATPKADDADTKLFENSLPHDSGSPGGDIGLDEEQLQADDASMVVVNQEEKESMAFSHDPNEWKLQTLPWMTMIMQWVVRPEKVQWSTHSDVRE